MSKENINSREHAEYELKIAEYEAQLAQLQQQYAMAVAVMRRKTSISCRLSKCVICMLQVSFLL